MAKKQSAPKTLTVQTAQLRSIPWAAILTGVREIIAAGGPDLRGRIDAYIATLKLRPVVRTILAAIVDSLLAAAGTS